MSDETDELAELDIDVVTITRDSDGCVSIDGGGMSLDGLVYLLQAAQFITMSEHFYPESDDDDDDD